jgi:hypothetical protein
MKINFHQFTMGDVEDPDIYAAEPIMSWQKTEQGRWVMEHAHNLTYHQQPDQHTWGHRFVIRGEINDPRKITEYFLRWPNQEKS